MNKIIGALIFGIISFSIYAADAPLKPTNFAYGMALQTDGRDGVYKVNVPLDVYRVVRYTDLRDVRVFNADGEVVPHVVTRSASSVNVKSEPVELPRFPIYASAESRISDLNLEIKRDTQGTVINLSNRSGAAGQNKLVGYLLDGSKVGPAIDEIEVQWSDDLANYVGSLTIEASDDLATWWTLAKEAPVTRMKFGDHLLEKRRIKFTPTPLIYVRLSGAALPELTRVMAIPADARSDVQRAWINATGRPAPSKPGEYEFDVGALIPLDRIRIELPQMNTLVQTELLARGSAKERWQNVTQTTVYRITQNGREFNSDELKLSRDSRRYWLLRIAQQGGDVGAGVPNLKAGWLADQILFLARGRGPFQLAYGAEGVKSGEVAITALMASSDSKSGIQARPIGLGSQISLGGEARLASIPDPFPWKKWTLWGALGLGVILMGWMASRLMGQMNKENQFEDKDAKR
jgi:Protein of unknown function (DUF3999)